MPRFYLPLTLLFLCTILSCTSDSENQEIVEVLPNASIGYFPPLNSTEWEKISPEAFNWNTDAEEALYVFLEEKNTDAFLMLKNGRIVLEKYFGDFKQNDNHAWNSVGKTLTAMTVGIAKEEGYLSLTDSSFLYLGTGWSSMTQEREQSVTILNHLTMTTGLDYSVDDIFCYDPDCLSYKNEPNDFWFYHNAPYTLLDNIVSNAVNTSFEAYFYNTIRDRIGMQGLWVPFGYNNVFFSTARSMARFGILNLNKGNWDGNTILGDTEYFEAMTNTSQNLNQSYGYLFWLNGKASYRIPGSALEFAGKLIPNAPDDLYAGLGKNDQKLYIVPSEELVVVRMGGDASVTLLGPSSFDNELWDLLNDIIE